MTRRPKLIAKSDLPPTPGSAAAVALGCRCPVFDNEDLIGVMADGEQVYVVNGACDLHRAMFQHTLHRAEE